METGKVTPAPVPLTFASVMVARDLSATPVSVTVTSLPVNVTEFAMLAAAASTAVSVPADVIVSLNWKTMVWPVPINRDSTVSPDAAFMATPVARGSENGPSVPCTFRETTLTRESAAATGVTITLPDGEPVPNALVAVTVQVY